MAEKLMFNAGEFVVFPTHGVGKVLGTEDQEIAGYSLKLFIISFEQERMTLRVPVNKVTESGLRKISSKKAMENALEILKGRARVKRTMWSRRAQEYEAKINSGDPEFLAQVVRDLHRRPDQNEQSFSERQIFEKAIERLAGEVAVVDKTDIEKAHIKLEKILYVAPPKPEETSDGDTSEALNKAP